MLYEMSFYSLNLVFFIYFFLKKKQNVLVLLVFQSKKVLKNHNLTYIHFIYYNLFLQIFKLRFLVVPFTT